MPRRSSDSSKAFRPRALRQRIAKGLATATLAAGMASPARALDDDAYLGFGTFLTYAFGAERPWGWGLEARAGLTTRTWRDGECGVSRPFQYGGGALRFEWFPSNHTRLLVVAQGGQTFASFLRAHAELGLGYRMGDGHGLETLLGGEFGAHMGALGAVPGSSSIISIA